MTEFENAETVKEDAEVTIVPTLETPEYDDVTAKKIIEAVLFAAGYPVSYEKLSKALYMSTKKVKELVCQMTSCYGEDSDRGIILLAYEDTAQLCTKEQFAPQIKEVLGIKRGGNLSASSLEVLATVAYNQPVTRAYIDTVRGVDSVYAVNSLAEKGLIEVCGRLDAPGRPMLYRTTDDFLRCFGITSLSELPNVISENDDQKEKAVSEEDGQEI